MMGASREMRRFMNIDCKILLNDLFDEIARIKNMCVTAGTKYRLMAVAADITEVAEKLRNQVLARVCQEAVLDVDVDIDYMELSEQVLAMELEGLDNDGVVNEALEVLNDVLLQIDSQLSRRHKDEEYARLYEAEKRRYMNAGTSKRARQKFDEWKDYVCYGHPQLADIEDYRVEKLLHMFEKGVFATRVAHVQRARRYPDEVDFSQIDDENPLKKSIHKYYFELRRLVDFKDGCLVVDPVRVGRYFYVSRKEPYAKSHRTNFLKYMHKIGLAQEEMMHVEGIACTLPEVLSTSEAMPYWERLQKAGFVDEQYQLLPETTRKQAMYIADVFSDKLQLQTKWKPFQDLWHIKNLAQEKWEMQETGKPPILSEAIEAIFAS